MALHRDIHWIGRQWAVTGFGMQAIDQKLGGKFDIEMARLWDDGLTESLREQKWFKAEDFEKGLAMARKRYPEPPRATPQNRAAAAGIAGLAAEGRARCSASAGSAKTSSAKGREG
jgi:hypothetical protein